MSDENEMNNANYQEIEGHCKILTAKLATLSRGSTAAESVLEDLTDYYERAIQMRIMHNTTLIEEIKELKKSQSDFMSALTLWVTSLAGIGVVGIIFMYPMAVMAVVGTYWSHVVVAAMTAGTTLWARRV